MRSWFIICHLVTGVVIDASAYGRDFEEVFSEIRQKASERSPDIKSALELVRQKGGAEYTAWTHWLPQAKFQTSLFRTKDYSLKQSGMTGAFAGQLPEPTQLDLKRWELSATLPIYNRNVHLGVEQATIEKRAAEQQLKMRVTEQDWKLRSNLGNYLLAAYRVATSQSALEAARTAQKEAKVRFELGQKTKIDVLKADSNLTSLEAKLLSDQQKLISERDAFLQYTGLSLDELKQTGLDEFTSSEDKLAATIAQFTESLDGKMKQLEPWLGDDQEARSKHLVDSSLSYQSLLTQEDLSRTRSRLIMAQEWPELAAFGSWNKQGQSWNSAFGGGDRSYSFGVRLTIPLSLGGSLFSTLRESNAASEMARIQKVRDTRSLLDQIESQRVQIQALLKTVEANRLRVDQNSEINRLSLVSYKLGRTSTLELLTAQNDLLASKVDLAESRVHLAVLARQFAWNLGVELE